MKFKIEQNLAVESAQLLRAHGYDAMTVYDQGIGGASDDVIAAVCNAESRIVITADLDFSDVRDFVPISAPGFIVLRLRNQARDSQLAAINRILPILEREPIHGRLWIVDETRVRMRGTRP